MMNKVPTVLFSPDPTICTEIDPLPDFASGTPPVPPGQLLYSQGTFSKTDGPNGSIDTITGLGFDPDFVMIIGVNNLADEFNSNSALSYIGWATSTDQGSINSGSRGGEVSVIAERCSSFNYGAHEMGIPASGAIVLSRGDLTLISDGFQIEWIINQARQSKIGYIAIGGGLCSFDVGVFNQPVSAGVQNVATSHSNANAVMLFSANSSATDFFEDDYQMSIGAAVSPSLQGSIGLYDGNGDNPNNGKRIQSDNSVISIINTVVESQAAFNGFTGSGFDLNWTTVNGLTPLIFYVSIKGGNWSLKRYDTTTTGGFHNTFEALTFSGQIGFTAGVGSGVGSINNISNTSRYSFGITSKIDESSSDNDMIHNAQQFNVSPTEINRYHDVNSVYFGLGNTTTQQAALSAFIGTQLRNTWTVSDGVARPTFILYGGP